MSKRPSPCLRPLQMLVQELERPLAVDRVRADEAFDRAAVADAQAGRRTGGGTLANS